jgi:hypothetical protein
MFAFCPHCGQTIGQDQAPGQRLVCRHCGREIGVVASPKPIVVDKTEELIRQSTAARCPLCAQVVAVKTTGGTKSLVPHFGLTEPRRLCPQSGKSLAETASPGPSPRSSPLTAKDWSALQTREVIKVVSCRKDADPRIEELTQEYLDKSDRVRLQIDVLREILGPQFRMQDYPPRLDKPDLALWGNPTACVVGKRNPQGGYQAMADAEIAAVLQDFGQHRRMFFP